ncbi:hypothetical protein Nepgr_033760 [Nepenthes gracilis]|uniref:Uncharacterized protein n=1 Tax=Nepenthes gracilis TaxID=150966 RepID=A0AAD3TMG3_NEPGR|nr:hypothetical protein Nepgr_033760 [Nepenthes gracilis]
MLVSQADSNPFAALQSSEADLLDSLPKGSGITDANVLVDPESASILGDESADPDCLPLPDKEANLLDSLHEGSGNSDINLLVELESTSILGDESADPDCLPLPNKEVEPLDEFPFDFESARLAGGSRIQRPSSSEPPLPIVTNLEEVPIGPSSTSISATPRSSCTARWVRVASPSHPVNLPHTQGVPMFRVVSKLRLLKERLKEINHNMGNVSKGVSRTRQALVDFQKNGPSIVPHLGTNVEDTLIADYRRALRLELDLLQ